MPPSVPPAPQLPQQALQEVFTYPDSSRDPVPGNKFSGARRLEIIGSPIAETVYMDVMRLRWPGASAAQLLAMISGPNFRAFTERAANAYQWKHMVNGPFPPNVNPHSAEEAHRIFVTYTGAVFVHYNDYVLVKNWFSDLMTAGI